MTTPRVIACVLALSFAATANVWGAEKKAAAKKQPVGRTETLACRLGTEDRHARIAVVVIKGKTDSFAYYSKWKPRTCSIYLQRNRDPYSKWADSGAITTINVEKGAFMIEHKPGEYHFVFRDVDRERYCGMDGVINGTLTIKRGKNECELGGEIMAEGPPLGHVPAAYANMQAPAAGTAKAVADAGAPAEPKADASAVASAPEASPAVATAASEPEVKSTATAAAQPQEKPTATAAVKPEAKATATAAAKPEEKATATAAAKPEEKATATAAAEPDAKATAIAAARPGSSPTVSEAAESEVASSGPSAAESSAQASAKASAEAESQPAAKATASAPAHVDPAAPGAVIGAEHTVSPTDKKTLASSAPAETGATRTATAEQGGAASGSGPLKALFRFLSPAEPEQQAP